MWLSRWHPTAKKHIKDVSTPTYNQCSVCYKLEGLGKSDDFVTYVSTKYNLRYGDMRNKPYPIGALRRVSRKNLSQGKKASINVALMKAIPDEKLVFKPFLFYFLQSVLWYNRVPKRFGR